MTIGYDEWGIDKEQSAGILREDRSSWSSFEQTRMSENSEGRGLLFLKYLITGNQGEQGDRKEKKIEGNKKAANYSPSWP